MRLDAQLIKKNIDKEIAGCSTALHVIYYLRIYFSFMHEDLLSTDRIGWHSFNGETTYIVNPKVHLLPDGSIIPPEEYR